VVLIALEKSLDEQKSLTGDRIGLIDVHLLAATFPTLGPRLWCLDAQQF
jgi:hypothetical protein